MADITFDDLAETTSLDGTERVPLNQGSDTKKATFATIRSHIEGRLRWTPFESSEFTATPPSTTTITVTTTTNVVVGSAIRFSQGSGYLYAIVTAVVTNTTLTIAGAALNTGASITALELGGTGTVEQLDITIPGSYSASTTTTLMASSGLYKRWMGRTAYLAQMQVTQSIADSGTEPKVQIRFNSQGVLTDNTNTGLQLSSAGTWVVSTGVDTTKYDINAGEDIEIEVSAAGGDGDAQDLHVSMLLVVA